MENEEIRFPRINLHLLDEGRFYNESSLIKLDTSNASGMIFSKNFCHICYESKYQSNLRWINSSRNYGDIKSSKNFKRIIRWYKLYIASKDPCVFTPETLEENIKGQGSVICKFARRSRHLGWEFVICQQQIAQVYDQANKRVWWMPRQLEAMKDVVVCDKLGGAD